MGNKNWRKWARELAQALKSWYSQNGYRYGVDFARDLGIEKAPWETIMRGGGIVEAADPTVYARIYLRTGLKQSDPRTIPFVKGRLPSGEVYRKERVWSDEQYLLWLKEVAASESGLASLAQDRLSGQGLFVTEGTPAEPKEPFLAQVIPSNTLGEMLDRAIDTFAQQVARQVAASLRGEISQKLDALAGQSKEMGFVSVPVVLQAKADASTSEVAKAADHLYELLLPLLESEDSALRDRLAHELGPEHLGRLVYALSALTEEDRSREEAVANWRLSRRFSEEVQR